MAQVDSNLGVTQPDEWNESGPIGLNVLPDVPRLFMLVGLLTQVKFLSFKTMLQTQPWF